MSTYKPMDFVVGDLVYYTGDVNPLSTVHARAKNTPKRVGIVVKVDSSGFHTYNVYWLKDQLMSKHLANNLELVYNV